jgi:phosphoglycerate dehydrogenase-like enzyme
MTPSSPLRSWLLSEPKASNWRNFCSQSDFISLHVPLTDETRGLINRDRVALMKHGTFLINTSRGEVCDLDALYEGLQSGKLSGVALDVFPNEPPDLNHPIFRHPNFIGTPHVASHTPRNPQPHGFSCG